MRVELFIPTTYDVDIPYDNTLELEGITRQFSLEFGGCTLRRETGFYYSSDKDKIIKEEVDIVYSFTSLPRQELELYLTTLAKALCIKMKQECILFVIDSEPYFINKN